MDFVLQIVNNDVLKTSRLNAIVNLKYFNVDPHILLDNIIGDVYDGNLIDAAARNFSNREVDLVMRLAVAHADNVDGIIEEMKKTEKYIF